MKPFLFLFLCLFILSIECIQWKKQLLRTYIIKRDNPITEKKLSAYTVYDSTGIKPLYRLKSTSADIDTILVIRLPQNDMIANMEGEWIENTFNVTFSLYDKILNKWTDGIIKREWSWLRDKYSALWNKKSLKTKTSFWTSLMQIFTGSNEELLGEVRKDTAWFSGNVKFELKVFSNQFSDIIYFFLIAINDHRYQISIMDDSSEE